MVSASSRRRSYSASAQTSRSLSMPRAEHFCSRRSTAMRPSTATPRSLAREMLVAASASASRSPRSSSAMEGPALDSCCGCCCFGGNFCLRLLASSIAGASTFSSDCSLRAAFSRPSEVEAVDASSMMTSTLLTRCECTSFLSNMRNLLKASRATECVLGLSSANCSTRCGAMAETALVLSTSAPERLNRAKSVSTSFFVEASRESSWTADDNRCKGSAPTARRNESASKAADRTCQALSWRASTRDETTCAPQVIMLTNTPSVRSRSNASFVRWRTLRSVSLTEAMRFRVAGADSTPSFIKLSIASSLTSGEGSSNFSAPLFELRCGMEDGQKAWQAS
mmetsp:Transcript_42916/g.100757  ORF Transcript_42916/g.100757 Transcript_42916/m.100757 type:complete len:339 (-) Transcript_42916:1249-2265(-)